MKKDQKIALVSGIYKKLFLIFTILVAIVLNVYLVLAVTRYRTQAAEVTAEFFFEPESTSIPPETSFKLMLDPKSQGITFVRVSAYFDPALVRLTSDISVNSSLFDITPPLTSTAESNSTGYINLALNLKEEFWASPPSQVFEVASLPFGYISANSEAETDITIIDEDTQVVDTNGAIPFSIQYANIALASTDSESGETKKATAKMAAAGDKRDEQGDCADGHIDTAIGCIPYSASALASFFYKWGIGIAGGIALVLIVYSGYLISMSAGDPKRLQAGKELLTAAVFGLVFLVFAAYLLRVVGLDILQIPGF